jgi:hypothetical protein
MILFAIFALFFYWQVKKLNWNADELYLKNVFWLVLAFILIPINWLLEWLKWKATLRILEVRTTNRTERHAFLAGIVTGMLTPNMLGNFIGRIYYFERRYRNPLVILTLVGNYAQFAASMLFGMISFFLLQNSPLFHELEGWKWLFIVGFIVVVLFYFNFEWITKLFFKRKQSVHRFIRTLNRRRSFRWTIFGLSIVRHTIFTIQFACVLAAFGNEISWVNILWIWQVYFWVTLAPSLFLGKIVIRESISVWVLAFAGMNEITVVASSFIIWVFNLLLPTLIAVVVCKGKKENA